MMIYAATLLAFLFLLLALGLGLILTRGRGRELPYVRGCGAPGCCSAPTQEKS
jgi:hypothetical protein